MDFYKRAEEVCRRIPYGTVATYGQIALLCGFPRHARQVGYFLRNCNTDIPAHRVINAKGFLSGAASFETEGLQKMLLEKEGVKVNGENIVDLKKYQWKNSMDDALELKAWFEQQGI